jgi:uncharacterized membrane protein YeaQ/YmgE (transglycosylase-associated protein family)
VLALLDVATHDLVTWVVIGLIAGTLAGRLVWGSGLGCLLDIVVGLAGALIGGLIVNQESPGLIGAGGLGGVVEDTLVAFVGAVILLAVVSLLTPGGRRRSARSRVSRR